MVEVVASTDAAEVVAVTGRVVGTDVMMGVVTEGTEVVTGSTEDVSTVVVMGTDVVVVKAIREVRTLLVETETVYQ